MTKLTFISTVLLVFGVWISAAKAQDGFTDKTEAKNEMKEGLKTGKWCTWLDNNSQVTTDAGGASFYSLAIYHGGKPSGKVRQFDMSDRLVSENIYFDGKLSDMRLYHVNGKLYLETPFSDGKKSGTVKVYYESGILMCETPYLNGNKNGIEKTYYESGILMKETPYANGLKNGMEKNFLENGGVVSEVDYRDGKMYTVSSSHSSHVYHGRRTYSKHKRHYKKHK
jgi:antitoxin component YwqK of YwqJK toxin-antitoxin module